MKKSNKIVWVVGRIHPHDADLPPGFRAWQLMGIFPNRPTAIFNCSTDCDFVGPVEVGVKLPDEAVSWPGAFYPRMA